MKSLSLTLSRKSVLTIWNSLPGLILLTQIIFDKSFNESFKEQLKWFSIKQHHNYWSDKGNISYQGLALGSSAGKRGPRGFFFHKITQWLLPSYLQTCLNNVSEGANLTWSRTQNKIKPIPVRTKVRILFSHIKEWIKLNDKSEIKNNPSINSN